MTKQIIDNLQPGTLDGDSLYIAAEKINANFNEIFIAQLATFIGKRPFLIISIYDIATILEIMKV